MCWLRSGVINVSALDARPSLVKAAINHQHLCRRKLCQLAGFIEQMLVGHRLAAAHAGIAGDDQLGLGIVDASGQRTGRKTAKNHGVDGANAGTSENGKRGLRNHRHVNQNAIALANAQGLHDRGRAHHFGLQFGKGIGLLLVGLGRDINQCAIVRPLRGMAVNGVMAEVGLAADKPLRERRARKITNLLRLRLPVDQFRLLGPELVALLNRTLVKIGVFTHDIPRWLVTCGRY
jgi:hypothetical protein